LNKNLINKIRIILKKLKNKLRKSLNKKDNKISRGSIKTIVEHKKNRFKKRKIHTNKNIPKRIRRKPQHFRIKRTSDPIKKDPKKEPLSLDNIP